MSKDLLYHDPLDYTDEHHVAFDHRGDAAFLAAGAWARRERLTRRLVATWNACEGVPLATLDGLSVKSLVAENARLRDALGHVANRIEDVADHSEWDAAACLRAIAKHTRFVASETAKGVPPR